MIYDSKVSVKPVEENSELMELLENTENRFEFNTMMEATAIVLAEQETNWTRFMEGVGLSELASVMEGEEIVYEGSRLEAIKDNIVKFLEQAIKKLAELTKAFVNKVQEWDGSSKLFLKKFENKIKGAKLESYSGYSFNNYEEHPDYTKGMFYKDGYTKEFAQNSVFRNDKVEGKTFNDKLTSYFYGTKKKQELKNIDINDQITILKETSSLKGNANKSYNTAASQIKKIISNIKKSKGSASYDSVKEDFAKQLEYYKAFSNVISQAHGTYLRVLGHRNRQALAMCTAAAAKSMKKNKVKEEPKKEEPKQLAGPKNEGFVNTEAFLGAIEFI